MKLLVIKRAMTIFGSIFGIMLCLGIFEVQTARANLTDDQRIHYNALKKAFEDYTRINLASNNDKNPAVGRYDAFLGHFRLFLLSVGVPAKQLPTFCEQLPIPQEIKDIVEQVKTTSTPLTEKQKVRYEALQAALREYKDSDHAIEDYENLMYRFDSLLRSLNKQGPKFFTKLPVPEEVKNTIETLVSYQPSNIIPLEQYIDQTLRKAGYTPSLLAQTSLNPDKKDEESKNAAQSLDLVHRYLYNPSPSCKATSCSISGHRAAPHTPSASNLNAEKDDEDEDEIRMPTFHEEENAKK